MTPSAWRAMAAEDFSRQLALPQQKRLFEHWLRLGDDGRDGDAWPARRAIRPADIRELLANLLIIEPLPMPRGLRVNFAGSALWDVHGGEITGQTLQDGLGSRHADHWRRIHENLLAHPLPDCGHLQDTSRMSVIFWLRLPITADDGATWLLGLDIALPLSKAQGLAGMAGAPLATPPREAARGGDGAA